MIDKNTREYEDNFKKTASDLRRAARVSFLCEMLQMECAAIEKDLIEISGAKPKDGHLTGSADARTAVNILGVLAGVSPLYHFLKGRQCNDMVNSMKAGYESIISQMKEQGVEHVPNSPFEDLK